MYCVCTVVVLSHRILKNPAHTTMIQAQQLGKVLQRREVMATLLVVPTVYFYFGDLVTSLDGSLVKATLIVLFFWVAMAVDVSQHMTGQPEAGHHHD
jgi:hypothetical protein